MVLVGRMGHQRLEALRQLRMRQMGGSTAVSRSIERVNEGASDSTDWVNCQTVRPNGTTKIIGDQPRGAWVTSQGQAASGRRVHAPPSPPCRTLLKKCRTVSTCTAATSTSTDTSAAVQYSVRCALESAVFLCRSARA